MIAKIPDKRSDGDSSFKDLVEYITNKDPDSHEVSDELSTSDQRRSIDVLRTVGVNLRAAADHLRAVGRVDSLDADAVRIRLESIGRPAAPDAAKHVRHSHDAGESAGDINDGTEAKRRLARIKHNLRAAASYLRQAPEADRDFQARARTRRANLAFNAEASERRDRRDAASSDRESIDLTSLLGDTPQRITTPTGIVCQHTCISLETASAEMNAVAAQNARVNDPVYHVVISWATGENPTDDEAFSSAEYALRAVGMLDHQYVFAIHRDTENVHVHIAVNRVNPETFRAVYPERDYYKLDYAMRELELANDWQRVDGVYSIFERNGKTVIDWSSASPNSKGKRPSKASDMERHDGVESLFSYVRDKPRKAVAKLLKRESVTWQAVHRLLAEYDLYLEPKGQGFAIYSKSSPDVTPVKASDLHEGLSRSRLEKRLGEFKPAIDIVVEPLTGYDKHRPVKRDPKVREERRQERASARKALREQYTNYKKSFVRKELNKDDVRKLFDELAAKARDRRGAVKNSGASTAAKKALYSVIAFETLREREQLKAEIATKRKALRADPLNKAMTFREWVEEQAASGNNAAVSQMRGWAYADKRKATALDRLDEDSGLDGARADQAYDPKAISTIDGLTYKVRRDGAVHYRNAQGQDRFIDRGRTVHLAPGASMDRDAVAQALRLAVEKYGNTFELTGSNAFQRLAVEIMAEYKMSVTLKQPDQELLRQAAYAEMQAKASKKATTPRNST